MNNHIPDDRLPRNYYGTLKLERNLTELNDEIRAAFGAKLDRRLLVQRVLLDWVIRWKSGEIRTTDLFREFKEG
jgi:hypothetical protein